MQQEIARERVRCRSLFSIRALVVCLVLLLAAACRARGPAPAPARVTLKIGVALPEIRQRSSVAGLAEGLSSEPLVGVGFDGRPQPALAESWEALSDGPGLRLNLRAGVLFHNGQPADAGTIARILREVIESFRKQGGSGPENIRSITAASDRQIDIRYYRPDAFFLPDLNIFNIADPKDPQLRTGPFRVASPGPNVLLEAFHRYHEGAQFIQTIELHGYQTQRKAWTAMMRGEVNALYEVSREASDFVEAETAVQTYPMLRPYHVVLVFNERHPILSRNDVRIALNEAVDRDAIVRDAMRGRGLPADGPIWPFHWAYSSAQRSFAFNPDAARLRLDAAGFTAGRHRAPGEMSSRFRFTCLVPSDDTRFERIALVLQRQLFAIGVDMQIQAVPTVEMVGTAGRVPRGDFEAFLFEMTSGRALSWLYRFWHSPAAGANTMMNTGYRGADEVLDRLRAAQSDGETRLAVSDLQRVLYEDPPAIFLVWPREMRAVDARFRVPHLSDRDVMTSVREWRLMPPDLKASR